MYQVKLTDLLFLQHLVVVTNVAVVAITSANNTGHQFLYVLFEYGHTLSTELGHTRAGSRIHIYMHARTTRASVHKSFIVY